jgi:DNA-binding response OmpR family regulator
MSDHVFAVDDDPALWPLIALSLRTIGFRVAAFESPFAALREIADPGEPNPIALILDLNMPEMDGRLFYQKAREAGLTRPVLILSAYGAQAACAELGAEAAMTKPFDSLSSGETIERMTHASRKS